MAKEKEIPVEHYGVTHVDVIRKLKAENKKLRNALGKIDKEIVPFPDTQAYYFQEIAREALKDGE